MTILASVFPPLPLPALPGWYVRAAGGGHLPQDLGGAASLFQALESCDASDLFILVPTQESSVLSLCSEPLSSNGTVDKLLFEKTTL